MRIVLACLAVAIAWVGLNAGQSAKVSNLEDHDKAMKAIGAAFGAASKALAAGTSADAKAQLGTLRSNMTAVQAFWEANKKTEQAKFANDVVVEIDEADDLLTDNDVSAAEAALKQIQGLCGACHKVTRDPDPANPKSFIVKPGLL